METVANDNGLTKCAAASVMITRTSAPSFISNLTNCGVLYAAMLPVTATTIFLPFKDII